MGVDVAARALDMLLMASVLSVGIGTVILGRLSLKDPKKIASSFNPISREREVDGLDLALSKSRRAKVENWRLRGTAMVFFGVLFQVLHTLVSAADDISGSLDQIVGWSVGVGMVWGLWRHAREEGDKRERAIKRGGGGWVAAESGPESQ